MNINALRYAYVSTLEDWSEVEKLLGSSMAETAREQKMDTDRLVDEALTGVSSGRFEELRQLAREGVHETPDPVPVAWRHTLLPGNTFFDGKAYQLLDDYEQVQQEFKWMGGTLEPLYAGPGVRGEPA